MEQMEQRVLEKCPTLTQLDLGWNFVRVPGTQRLVGILGQCTSLTVLDLSGNGFDDDGDVILRMSWCGHDSGLGLTKTIFQYVSVHPESSMQYIYMGVGVMRDQKPKIEESSSC